MADSQYYRLLHSSAPQMADEEGSASEDGFSRLSEGAVGSNPPDSEQFADADDEGPCVKRVKLVSQVLLTADEIRLNAGWENFLSRATTAVTQHLPPLPWEVGTAGRVLGSHKQVHSCFNLKPLNSVLIPDDPETTSAAASSSNCISAMNNLKGSWPVVGRRLCNVSWKSKDGIARDRALERLKVFFQVSPQDTGLGRRLMNDVMTLQGDESLMRSIQLVFANKSTATLTAVLPASKVRVILCKEWAAVITCDRVCSILVP